MTIFHGTNATITKDIRKDTFFTDSFSIAMHYMENKNGNKIYAFSNDKDVINYMFNETDGNFVAKQDIPINKFTCLTVKSEY